MTGDERKLVSHRLARAEETLRDGRTLLEADSLHGAVNRFYYAAFYAARAVLGSAGLDSSRHSGVIALFNQHFVKTGKISSEPASILLKAFEARQETDYEDFITLTRSEIEALGGEVSAFIDECRRYLAPELGEEPS